MNKADLVKSMAEEKHIDQNRCRKGFECLCGKR